MTTRKTKSEPAPIRPKILEFGLDIGYGHTKITNGETHVVFPSVAGHAHHIKYQADKISGKYPGDELTDDDGDWFIGEMAIKHVPAKQQIQLQGRNASEGFDMDFRLRMMKSALAKIAPHQNGDVIHITIATGLPVSHMGDAARMKEAIIGRHHIKTNNADFIANVVNCIVMPQPYGTIYSQMFTLDGDLNPYHTAQKTAVVDIGRYTVDCALDDDADFIDAESDSVESGVYTAQQRIAAAFEAEHRSTPTYEQVDKLLRTGMVKISGVPTNYTSQVDESLKPLRDAVLSLMGRLWGSAKHIDLILLCGGGVTFVDKDILQVYPQAMVVSDPQTSNARGYLQYARYISRQ